MAFVAEHTTTWDGVQGSFLEMQQRPVTRVVETQKLKPHLTQVYITRAKLCIHMVAMVNMHPSFVPEALNFRN